jgi:AraC family transcriptional regulator
MKHSALACSILLAGCAATTAHQRPDATEALQTDLALSLAPFEHVEANWKQRLDQPYVYIELRGSYTEIGRTLERVDQALRAQAIEPSGPPFALYYDDPGQVAASELRSRACFPVSQRVDARAPLAFDVLPGTTVVYAYVAGPYPEVPRAYPGIYGYLAHMHWREAGPIREIYLVNPATVQSYDQLVTEVQIPASAAN